VLHFYIIYGIWRCRNAKIIEEIVPVVSIISLKIMDYFLEFGPWHPNHIGKIGAIGKIDLSKIVAYFNGSSTNGECMCGKHVALNTRM